MRRPPPGSYSAVGPRSSSCPAAMPSTRRPRGFPLGKRAQTVESWAERSGRRVPTHVGVSPFAGRWPGRGAFVSIPRQGGERLPSFEKGAGTTYPTLLRRTRPRPDTRPCPPVDGEIFRYSVQWAVSFAASAFAQRRWLERDARVKATATVGVVGLLEWWTTGRNRGSPHKKRVHRGAPRRRCRGSQPAESSRGGPAGS